MLDLLEQLCEINGTSGDESRVAEFVASRINPQGVNVHRDSLGNLLVFKKGRETPPKLVMFAAHMDEVGLIITDITKEGFLRFSSVGGINPGVVFGRRVVFSNTIMGVIASKPVHLLNEKEKDTQPKIKDLLIDIGAADKSEAEKHVSPGDYCYFVSEYTQQNGHIFSKAIDNRLGCAVMLDMINQELEYDCVFAFTVQEEIGCKGAGCAVYNLRNLRNLKNLNLNHEICVVLEATTACDTAGVSDKDKVCELGKGPVISFMDKGTVYDRQLYNMAVLTAKENNIKSQTKNKIVGGNDASVIHKSAGGMRTIAVSAPCRYLHTPHCVMNKQDAVETRLLAEKLLCKFAVL